MMGPNKTQYCDPRQCEKIHQLRLWGKTPVNMFVICKNKKTKIGVQNI